jgi:hypothetical protein
MTKERVINLETLTSGLPFLVCSVMNPGAEDPIPLQVKCHPEKTEVSNAGDKIQESKGKYCFPCTCII